MIGSIALRIEVLPVDQLGELDQLVTHIHEVFKAMTKQVVGGEIRWRLRFHFVVRTCQLRDDILSFSGNIFSAKWLFSKMLSETCEFFRTD